MSNVADAGNRAPFLETEHLEGNDVVGVANSVRGIVEGAVESPNGWHFTTQGNLDVERGELFLTHLQLAPEVATAVWKQLTGEDDLPEIAGAGEGFSVTVLHDSDPNETTISLSPYRHDPYKPDVETGGALLVFTMDRMGHTNVEADRNFTGKLTGVSKAQAMEAFLSPVETAVGEASGPAS